MSIDRPRLRSSGTELPLSEGAAFIDDEIVPIGEARIPITDTGFLRSDVTYDVAAVWNGSFFRLDAHLDRFERGCRELRLTLPMARDEMVSVLHELVGVTALRDAYVEVICTRGLAERGVRDPRRFKNRLYAWVVPYVWLLAPADAERGMDAVIARTVRRIPSSSVDPTVKNFHWGDLTRGLYEAYDRGARYPILLDADDNVTEGAGYNIFAYHDGTLITPDAGVLEGITRLTILELAERHGIRAFVQSLPVAVLRDAAEVFATSTAGGVMPITSLDGQSVGDGSVGSVTRRLRDLYWAAHDDPEYAMPVDYRPPARERSDAALA
jgi:branched-chain amino acid aminotransferase